MGVSSTYRKIKKIEWFFVRHKQTISKRLKKMNEDEYLANNVSFQFFFYCRD